MARTPRQKPRHVNVLAAGLGIQSTTLALMLDRSMVPDCPKPEYAAFADTLSEPPHVYETLDWLAARLSYPIITISFGDLGANTWKALRGEPVPERGHQEGGYIDLPVFTETGLAKRQCTASYKLFPIKRLIRRRAGISPPALTATQYLGISSNEIKRAKPSRQQWLSNRYPLVEMGLDREWCKQFLDTEYPGHPVRRSACFFAPSTPPTNGRRFASCIRTSMKRRSTWNGRWRITRAARGS